MLALLGLAACGGQSPVGSDTDSTLQDPGLPAQYAFDSRFDGMDSVSYSGQVFRNLLIHDMKAHLGGVTDRISGGEVFPVHGDVEAELNFYFEFSSVTSGTLEHLMVTDPAALQRRYDDLSSGKDLVEKLAGNDANGQHKDWSTELVGWDAPGVTSPESLVRSWIGRIDDQAVLFSSGNPPLDPDGIPVDAIYLTPEGQDLQQLLEKFLRGAVAFSQGVDDYLDDDLDGKGLNSDHAAADDGSNYTPLEHAWDEGFGYFGAARTYPSWSDDEIADDGHSDVDGDGAIDLKSEVCSGHSVNAAKRDRGSVSTAPTDFTADAWEGFARGRQLLADTQGPLTADEMSALQGYRDQAVDAWESSISATVVHYINDTLQDMGTFDTEDYSFSDHAKHWSEMKGFALSLQFNPRSPLSDGDFERVHDLMGTAPVLEDATQQEREDYAAGLIEARTILGDAYGFNPANLGDDGGENGW